PTIWPETVQCAQYRLQHQTYPLLTKWVCARTRDVDAHLICCRLQHHRPTSHEVGMRENLTRTPVTPQSCNLIGDVRFLSPLCSVAGATVIVIASGTQALLKERCGARPKLEPHGHAKHNPPRCRWARACTRRRRRGPPDLAIHH